MGDAEGGFLAGVFLASVSWCTVICWPVTNAWQGATIDHKAAHYDTKTAKFTWNDEVADGSAQPKTSQTARQQQPEEQAGK